MAKITSQTAAIQRAVLVVKDRLATASIDELIPHAEIKSLIPNRLGVTHYLIVARAQRLLNAENGAVFATVRNEGYRRLANIVGADHASSTALLRIRSQSRKGQKTTTMAIKFANDASDADKRRIYQKLSSLGLIEHLTINKTVQVLSEDRPTHDSLKGLRALLDSAAGQ